MINCAGRGLIFFMLLFLYCFSLFSHHYACLQPECFMKINCLHRIYMPSFAFFYGFDFIRLTSKNEFLLMFYKIICVVIQTFMNKVIRLKQIQVNLAFFPCRNRIFGCLHSSISLEHYFISSELDKVGRIIINLFILYRKMNIKMFFRLL